MGVSGAIAAIGALISAGATTYGVVKQGEARDEQKKMAREQQDRQNALETEKRQKEVDQRNEEIRTAINMGQVRRSRAAAGQSGTSLLTSPLGQPGQAAPQNKTLLGA